MTLINYKALMELGYKEHTARTIIRQAKSRLIEKGYELYMNKRCGLVPLPIVEEIIGTNLKGGN